MASARTSGKKCLLKLAVIGDKQVGKTSLLNHYLHGSYSPHYISTQGGDINTINVSISNYRVQVTLIDAAGSEYVRTLIKTLYRDVQGVMVVFDLTKAATFDTVPQWLEQIKLVNSSNPVIFLVGNKQDMTSYRAVPNEQAMTQSQRWDVEYFETSARTGHNVRETFAHLMYHAWHRTLPRHVPIDTIVLTAADQNTMANNSCCTIL